MRTFIRHKDRQYKTETATDRIKKRLKKRTIPHKKLKLTKTYHKCHQIYYKQNR